MLTLFLTLLAVFASLVSSSPYSSKNLPRQLNSNDGDNDGNDNSGSSDGGEQKATCSTFPPDSESDNDYIPFTLNQYSLTYRTCTKTYSVKLPINSTQTDTSSPSEFFDKNLYVHYMLCPSETCGDVDGWKANCGVYVVPLEDYLTTMVAYESTKASKFCTHCTVCSYTDTYRRSPFHATSNFCAVCDKRCPQTSSSDTVPLTGLTSDCVPILTSDGNATGYYSAPNCVSGKITISVYTESSCMRRIDLSYKSVSANNHKLEELPKYLNSRTCISCLPSPHKNSETNLYESYSFEYYSSLSTKSFCSSQYFTPGLRCEQDIPGTRWCSESSWTLNGKVCNIMSHADSWTYRSISSAGLNPYSTEVSMYVNRTSYPTVVIISWLVVVPMFFVLLGYQKFLRMRRDIVKRDGSLGSIKEFQEGEGEEGKKELRMTGSIMSYDSMEERVNQYMPF
ncbi:hypothetical protein TrST_g11909 [Triparma strigata]|uniref:TNFR-Cys domain-containing protein n=1 Tax=Triparma strigata TaxID=1606541 RepID=A0A9W7DRW9_9STRA|nr:hypothetical protein TrST_g11909 [Triparma strigata]